MFPSVRLISVCAACAHLNIDALRFAAKHKSHPQQTAAGAAKIADGEQTGSSGAGESRAGAERDKTILNVSVQGLRAEQREWFERMMLRNLGTHGSVRTVSRPANSATDASNQQTAMPSSQQQQQTSGSSSRGPRACFTMDGWTLRSHDGQKLLDVADIAEVKCLKKTITITTRTQTLLKLHAETDDAAQDLSGKLLEKKKHIDQEIARLRQVTREEHQVAQDAAMRLINSKREQQQQ